MINILQKPLVTEKASSLNEKGVYGLLVAREANKISIKKAVEETYHVTVVRVNTMCYAGKNKARYTKAGLSRGKKAAYKKALVSLKAGEVIDFYSHNS